MKTCSKSTVKSRFRKKNILGVAFIGIPFYTLAKYRPMGEAVKSLRAGGIVRRIRSADSDLVDFGDVDCPLIERDHGPKNLRNFEEFLEGTRRVKDKLGRPNRPLHDHFLP